IFARGFGDCKDKATLIVTMLSALGIKATPVAVRTANKGTIEPSPASLAPFDHMIAYVPSLDLYLDGTAEYSGSRELPAMDRGAMALQINEGDAKLVTLPEPPAAESVSAHRMDATVAPDGSAQIDWQAQISGVEASAWRARFHAVATRKERIERMMAALLPGSEVSAVEAGDLDDVEQDVSLRVRVRVPQLARAEGDAFTLPIGPREHMVRAYATLATRTMPVRMLAQWTESDDWTVHLPAGEKVRSLPAATSGSSPFGSYAVKTANLGGAIRVRTTVTLVKTRISPSEYPAFRAWCEEVDRALGQRATVTSK
ncbi:MAG: DUF3858 domain-containing protein, partial [Polyangiaceae bacterium]